MVVRSRLKKCNKIIFLTFERVGVFSFLVTRIYRQLYSYQIYTIFATQILREDQFLGKMAPTRDNTDSCICTEIQRVLCEQSPAQVGLYRTLIRKFHLESNPQLDRTPRIKNSQTGNLNRTRQNNFRRPATRPDRDILTRTRPETEIL